jgi:hypothetical protein
MKPITLAGVTLILLGVLALTYQGLAYTTRETALDLGPLHTRPDPTLRLALTPWLGIGAVMTGGMTLAFAGVRRPRQ